MQSSGLRLLVFGEENRQGCGPGSGVAVLVRIALQGQGRERRPLRAWKGLGHTANSQLPLANLLLIESILWWFLQCD